jgi:hypothetical protein
MDRARLAAACLVVAGVSGAVPAERSAAAVSPAVDRSLTCADFDKDGPAAHERRALRMAPEGARRLSDHVLAVTTRAGVRRFVDKKPYRQELDGFHWSYCGYVPALRAHLIGMEQDSLFTGKLLRDEDGGVLDGGQTVYPSPDGRLYLAESQVDGEDLSHWLLSDRAGRHLWAGLSGVSTEHDIQVEYGHPRWVANDVLRVSANCNDRSRARGEATLARDGRSWRWASRLRCKG